MVWIQFHWKLSHKCSLWTAASQAAEKAERFVGRGFSHDVNALDSSGVLTPEARKYHFSSAFSAATLRGLKNSF
jgi:hypothetical protein